jgi:hypothetical protein
MNLTREEFEKIKIACLAIRSEEMAEQEPPIEQFHTAKCIIEFFNDTDIFTQLHQVYHTIEKLHDCQTACSSVVLKMFLFGYECRKAIEENGKLLSIFNASLSSESSICE